MIKLPDPVDQPTLPVWPDTGRVLGLGRSSTYEAVKRGEIPTLKFGARLVVPTARLRQMLGLDTKANGA
jgi:hypothetical protein